jgi:hypothetical protein
MAKPAKKKAATDWEAIEREFRAGQLSLREIAREHGITDTAIRKKAKEFGWVRDLSEQVREKVRTELVRDAVRTPNAREPEIVEAAAARGVEVVREHRRDIAGARRRAARIGSQIDRLLEVLETMQPEDENFLGRVSSAASANNALSQALSRVIPLERQAFSLDEPEQGDTATALSAEQIRRMAQEVASQE